jgi:KRAB domain-containing zinc finger protein
MYHFFLQKADSTSRGQRSTMLNAKASRSGETRFTGRESVLNLAHGFSSTVNLTSDLQVGPISTEIFGTEESLGDPSSGRTLTYGVPPQKPCSLCGKIFASGWELRRHLNTHMDMRPFKCLYCNHRSNFKHNLKAHVKIQHSDKPFGFSIDDSSVQ